MSVLSIMGNVPAIGPNLKTYFAASGGTPPYVYSVVPGGAGGSIDPNTGQYTSPLAVSNQDVIQVTDFVLATATAPINVCTAIELFCDVLQQELGLANGRVYLWDQKINQPSDSNLYIAVQIMSVKPFGNNIKFDGSSIEGIQSANFQALLNVMAMSRGPDARNRKEEILLALKSYYSQSQQQLNSFFIAPLSSSFMDISNVDGAAIPYRFNITVAIQYFVTKTKAVDYFDTFPNVVVKTEP